MPARRSPAHAASEAMRVKVVVASINALRNTLKFSNESFLTAYLPMCLSPLYYFGSLDKPQNHPSTPGKTQRSVRSPVPSTTVLPMPLP